VDPGTPSRRKPAHDHDPLQTRPVHRVERLGEVEFDDERPSSTFVGTLDDFQGMDEGLRDAAPPRGSRSG
jgi:hypothetical protein